jgi:hypothetical protein
VRGFIKAGLAGEPHRVGALLNDILEAATDLDWPSAALRRSPGPLPPVAVSMPLLPLVQRLRFKEPGGGEEADLDLSETTGSIEDMSEEFWDALDGLDRIALYGDTLHALESANSGLTLGELAEALPPTHDLETLAYWLGLGRETEAEFRDEREVFEIADRNGIATRFDVPRVTLEAAAVARVEPETLG